MPPPDISLGNWLFQRSKRTPDRRALTFEGKTWTYGELQLRIDRLASALRASGLCQGDRAAFIGFNQPAFFLCLFATARLGAIFVPLNFRLTGPELDYIINDAGVHTLVSDGHHRPLIESIKSSLPCRNYLLTDATAEGWDFLDDIMHGVPPLKQAEPLDADEVAVIMYTSGTTGRPKGTMLTHGNFWWNNSMAMLTLDLCESDVSLVPAPLFHIGGLNVTTLATFQKGGEIVLQRNFDPQRFLQDIRTYGVTTTFAVPSMLLFVSQHPEFNTESLGSLRMVVCGGAPVPEPLLRLYAGLGVPINQGYGLTETSPMVTFLTSEWSLKKLGSAGRAPLFVELRLVDGEGRAVTEPNGRGEILVKGPNVMKGYWNRPEATEDAIDAEGWFHTGDVGYLDEDGFLYICDRVKDMIISGGENIYPAEVEAALYEHQAIVEVAVLGLPDERWGEAVVAAVVLKEGHALSLEELREWATERIARYKLPTRLEIVDVLPRNPAGKVLKFELRGRFAG